MPFMLLRGQDYTVSLRTLAGVVDKGLATRLNKDELTGAQLMAR